MSEFGRAFIASLDEQDVQELRELLQINRTTVADTPEERGRKGYQGLAESVQETMHRMRTEGVLTAAELSEVLGMSKRSLS